ncbi:hypothetical protein TNCV_521321 [Trichonephila clavipes]|nr:hypothetical protein TNCV_521321 [Trichonephila clavipes]
MLTGPLRQVGLLCGRWQHHRSPPPQFRHGTGGERNILQPPPLWVSAATTHNNFGTTDLTSTLWGHRTSNLGLTVWSPMPNH